MRLLSIFLIAFSLITCKQNLSPSKQHYLKLKAIENFKIPGFVIYDSILNIWSKRLTQVYYNDQFYRDIGNPSYFYQNSAKQDLLDFKNQQIVSIFLDSFGYKSLSEIGVLAQFGVNLTLIHAGIKFKNKYKAIIEQAFKEKKINPEFYARFIDRYLVQARKFQMYGTQVTKFNGISILFPIDPSKISTNRKAIGLKEDISDYLKNNFNYRFDSLKYLKTLPALIQFFKINSLHK